MQTLRPYQQRCVDKVLEFINNHPNGGRMMIAAPTGTGKGTVETALLSITPSVIVTPTPEINIGLVERGAEEERLFSYVSYRNRLVEGKEPAKVIIFDEAHHDVASNVCGDEIFSIAPSSCYIGFTATPYRGTARGTRELKERWGNVYQMLNIQEAVKEGFMQIPSIRIEPLLDDDLITIQNGEFQTQSANGIAFSRLEAICKFIGSLPKEPTVILLPSRDLVYAVSKALDYCKPILADTNRKERDTLYVNCKSGLIFLCTIGVVSEGWDAPWLIRLVDARPTMSPVRWLQAFGRITRPDEQQHEYVCLCRNLERHAYLLEGIIPSSMISKAVNMFGSPSERLGARVGLESVGKLMRLPIYMKDGSQASMYMVYRTEGFKVTEYAVILLPHTLEPLVAIRENTRNIDNGEKIWGKWKRTELPKEFKGFATSGWKFPMSPAQANWYKRDAAKFGLNPEVKLSAREFAVLPVLADLRMKIL